jgi:hypothetical protein
MKYINLHLNQHKTITTKKILKLRKIKKIKKRKIKTLKKSIANSGYDIKMEENKIKKNESNSGENSIQQIIQRADSLGEEINKYRNGSDEPVTNISNNNINNKNNNIRLDDSFSILKERTSPITKHRTSSQLEEHNFNFLPFQYELSSYHNFFSDFSLENEINFEQEYNRNLLDFEYPINIGNNIPLNNINNSNRIQNINTNNNNINIMNFHLDIPFNDSEDFSYRFSRISRTSIRNIKNKLTEKKFNKSESSNGNNERCIICYEDFKDNEKVYSLPCHHLFHVSCLNNEIKYRQKCPMCRNEL